MGKGAMEHALESVAYSACRDSEGVDLRRNCNLNPSPISQLFLAHLPTPTLKVLNHHNSATAPVLFVHHTPPNAAAPLSPPTKIPFDTYPYSNQPHYPIFNSLPTTLIKLHHTSAPQTLPILTSTSHPSNCTRTTSHRMVTASI